MKRVLSIMLSLIMVLSVISLPVASATEAQIYSPDDSGFLVSGFSKAKIWLSEPGDELVWTVSEQSAGKSSFEIELVKGSSLIVTATISGVKQIPVMIDAADNATYDLGSFSLSEGDTLAFTTDSFAGINAIRKQNDLFFSKDNAVCNSEWKKTESSWKDYDGTTAWYTGGSTITAKWTFSDVSGNHDFYYYIPAGAQNSEAFNTKVVIVDKTTGTVLHTQDFTKGPTNNGWYKVAGLDFNKDNLYEITVQKGSGTYSGGFARLCAAKIGSNSDVPEDIILSSDNTFLSLNAAAEFNDCIYAKGTETATASVNIPSGTGMCNAKISVFAGTKAKVTVVASGVTYTKNIDVNENGILNLDAYDFTSGGSITVSNVENTKIRYIKLNPTMVTYLDTNDAKTISGFVASGLKGFSSAKGYYGSGAAVWNVPNTSSGKNTVYYYVPESGKGYTDCSVKVNVLFKDGKMKDWYLSGDQLEAGWHEIGNAEFAGDGTEIITVTGYAAEGVSATARVYGFKFVQTDEVYASYAFQADCFAPSDDWSMIEDYDGLTYSGILLRSTGVTGSNAKVVANVKNGRYYIYAHGCDYLDYSTGTRNYSIIANGTEFKREQNRLFGTHQLPGTNTGTDTKNTPVWEWEQAEYPKNYIDVTDGKLVLEVVAKTAFARMDMLVVTQDPFMTTKDLKMKVHSMERIEPASPYCDHIAYPKEYKTALSRVDKKIALSNENTTVTFKLGKLSNGNTMVQRETKVGDVVTNTFESGLGFLSIRADEAVKPQESGYYARFDVGYNSDLGYYRTSVSNIFQAGKPEWLIPTTLEKLSENSVKMTAVGEAADITAIWTLEEGDLEPKVDITATIKTAGTHTFGFFNDVNEIPVENVGYVLNPFRWQEKRMPKPGQLIRESSSTTNHTQMTHKINDKGQEITMGVAVDQSAVAPDRWTHDVDKYVRTDYYGNEFTVDYSDEQSNFALATTGNAGGVQPAVFAPLLTTEDSILEAGDTYTFSYRPLATVSTSGENRGWYDCYNHVVKDLRGLYDYRDNYYDSMTNTVFNLLNLLKNDEQSGWDDNKVGHYNIEDTYWVTNSNGLVYLQNYLLTEDNELLMERTLPIMGTLLTRNSSHLWSEWSIRDNPEGPINKDLTVTNIGMGNSTFEGAYLLTRGMMPIYRNIAKGRLMNTNVESGGLGLNNPSEGLWYDIAKGDTSYKNAVSMADNYLNKRSFESASNKLDEDLFINISYNPHFQSQLDVYEATGDEEYLDGAIEAARRFLPSLRTEDVPKDKTEMTVPDVEQLRNEAKIFVKSTWWLDGEGYRRGAEMAVSSDTTANGSVAITRVVKEPKADALVPTEEAYPKWVTARTGLGLEQFSTCVTKNANVFMSTWAGDILRLGYLSNDQVMMDMARSSIVGRFANYPGYYISDYDPVPGMKDYPISGFDTTSLYFHHIPVFLSAVEDYLFSNAYVKSSGQVDFPNTRSQGYAWFNNRIYGHEAGKIYGETDMWPWLKEGTITVNSKQIDWIAGRKDGRAAFVLTNAGDNDETVTVVLNKDLGVANGAKAAIYDKEGIMHYETVSNNTLTLTVPEKGILTFAVDGTEIKKPAYATVSFENNNNGSDLDLGNTAQGLMYAGNTYVPGNAMYSTDTGYDVKAYALSIDPNNYMGYVFVGGRSTSELGGDGDKGIVKTTLKWHYEGETEVTTVTDEDFPYEFFIPVNDRNKNIMFNVETEYKDGVKTLAKEAKIAPQQIEIEENINKTNFEPVSLSIINALGAVSAPLTKGKSKYCIGKGNISAIPIDVTADDALVGCHLSGYLKVKDLTSTTDIVERGYILFDNVPIVDSAINTSSNGRFDFSVDDIMLAASNIVTRETVDGVYVGEKQGMVNCTKVAKTTYEWDNLYITNAGTKTGLKVIREGNTYTISNDGAGSYFVIIATFDGDRMTDVVSESVIVSVNNSKTYTVSENQKLFVWNNNVNRGTTMKPVMNAIEFIK